MESLTIGELEEKYSKNQDTQLALCLAGYYAKENKYCSLNMKNF